MGFDLLSLDDLAAEGNVVQLNLELVYCLINSLTTGELTKEGLSRGMLYKGFWVSIESYLRDTRLELFR